MNSLHIPVLLNESLELAALTKGQTALDCTIGLAGHAKAFCSKLGNAGTYIGLDADPDNLALAKEVLKDVNCNVQYIHANFADIASLNLPKPDLLFADLGVSSLHFDLPERGFSHRFDGPLDLRLDRTSGKPFYELLQALNEDDILSILTEFGELVRPFALVRTIVERKFTLKTTTDLKAIIDEVYTYKAKQFYGQVFQAFRMYTNQELSALQELLRFAIESNIPRILIISFHSLEDRLVKHMFKAACTSTKHELTGQSLNDALYMPLTKKPVTPSDSELQLNPRSRSAKLRAICLQTL